MSNDGENLDANSVEQRRVLLIALALNLLLAASLAVTGVTADSSGLIANALDNASDAAVYAISLFAVGRSPRWKRVAATCSGVLLLIFGLGLLGDTVRRFITGSEPTGATMMAMAVIAAAVNLWCLKLLARLKQRDVNLRAARTFSLNDFISNGGVLVAGGLVAWTGRRWPDLVVGLAVVAIAMKGGVDILRDAWRSGDAVQEETSA
jgi:cobalt-zinc-cadmium efflux system protein